MLGCQVMFASLSIDLAKQLVCFEVTAIERVGSFGCCDCFILAMSTLVEFRNHRDAFRPHVLRLGIIRHA